MITLEHFHSSGNIPEIIDLLEIIDRELAIKSAHSFRSLAGMSSRPVALLRSSFKSRVCTFEELVGLISKVD